MVSAVFHSPLDNPPLDRLTAGRGHAAVAINSVAAHARHADAVNDGAVTPRLADAIAVHVAHAHVRHHLGGGTVMILASFMGLMP